MSILRDLAKFTAGLNWNNLPENIRREAEMKIMDNVAAGIGAGRNGQILRVVEEYKSLSGQGNGAPVWSQGFSAPLFTAVFLNAMQTHTLELDDVHTKSKAHIGTVVVPAAMSCASMLGSTGKELAVAVAAGYEVTARIAMAFGVKAHRKLGWHSTATAGVFGAAAACGKLLGLSEDELVNALGLGGAQSFGTWAFLADGASCKVLNPARAAQSGCEAAFLARAGMTGPEHILTSEDGGLLHMMSSEPVEAFANMSLGTDWEITQMDNKPYPCCRSTHCGIDGALAIREKYAVRPEDIRHVRVDTYLIGNQQCGTSPSSREPHTGPQARFSTPYCVAAAFIHGKVGLKEFDESVINGQAEQELLHRVEICTSDRFTQLYPGKWGCSVTVECKDGRVFTQEVPSASGSVDNPLSPRQARDKSVGLMEGVVGMERAQELAEQLLHVSDLSSVSELKL